MWIQRRYPHWSIYRQGEDYWCFCLTLEHFRIACSRETQLLRDGTGYHPQVAAINGSHRWQYPSYYALHQAWERLFDEPESFIMRVVLR